MGEYALAGWIALMVAIGLGLSVYATTWVDAKAIVLTSPVVVLLAWGGFAGLRSAANAPALRAGALALAVVLAGGIGVSDAMQYHAPTWRPPRDMKSWPR